MSYCIEEIPNHEENECQQYLNGGIGAYALINPDVDPFDYEDAAAWTALINAGRIKIVNNVALEFPQPTIFKVDNPSACGSTQIPSGIDFTLTGTDAHSNATNDLFYGSVNGKKFKMAFWECQNDTIKVITENVTANTTPARVPRSNKEFQMHDLLFEWSGGKNSYPVRYDAPVGIFHGDE